MITKELRELIASAGQAATREREAHEQRERERGIERVASERTRVEAKERARIAAVDAFAWIESDEARELRALMRDAGLQVVRIATSASWSALLTDDERSPLEVRRSPGTSAAAGLGRLQRRVASAHELADLAAPTLVLTLADDVSSGRALEHAANALRV